MRNKGDLNNLYTYYRIRFYLEIISFIIAILAVLITVNIKICFKNGIADDIIANKYYFNKKHILLLLLSRIYFQFCANRTKQICIKVCHHFYTSYYE